MVTNADVMKAAGIVRGRLLIGGEWQAGTGAPLDVLDKYTGAVIGAVECAGRAQVVLGIEGAVKVRTLTDLPDRFAPGSELSLDGVGRKVEWSRQQPAGLVVKKNEPSEAGIRRKKAK